MFNVTVSLFNYFLYRASVLPIALLFKCQYAVLVTTTGAALILRHFCFSLGYRKAKNIVLEMWVNMNKGVILLFRTCILFILSTSSASASATLFVAPASNRLHTGHFFVSQLQMNSHQHERRIIIYLPGSEKFRREQEYGSSLSSSGMGHPCLPTINFTPTLKKKIKSKHYCIHLFFCAILGGKISKACPSIHPPFPWLLRVA